MYMLGWKVKCLKFNFSTFFGVVFVPRFARYKNSIKKVSDLLDNVKFLDILLIIPTYTYPRCIVSFMPQYYFCVKLNAKNGKWKSAKLFTFVSGLKSYFYAPKRGWKVIAGVKSNWWDWKLTLWADKSDIKWILRIYKFNNNTQQGIKY